MSIFSRLFNKRVDSNEIRKTKEIQKKKNNEEIAQRKGAIGEYKIDIQLSQFPKNYRSLNDLFIKNPKAKTGYSQIDHVLITPYGIFVIETKNYQGTIYGNREQKNWIINGKFKMLNPLIQNYGHIESLKLCLDRKYHELFISMVSFTKRCKLKVDPEFRKISSNELVICDLELSEYINRKISFLKLQNPVALLNDSEIEMIHHCLLNKNIVDASEREKHNKILSGKKETITHNKNVQESKCISFGEGKKLLQNE